MSHVRTTPRVAMPTPTARNDGPKPLRKVRRRGQAFFLRGWIPYPEKGYSNLLNHGRIISAPKGLRLPTQLLRFLGDYRDLNKIRFGAMVSGYTNGISLIVQGL